MPPPVPPVPKPTYYPDAPGPVPNYAIPAASDPPFSYTVVPTPPPPPKSPIQVQQYPYLLWAMEEVTVCDPGYAVNPVAGPAGTPQDVVRVHGGSAQKAVAFVAMRIGANPVVPTRAPTQPNDVQAPWVLSTSLVGFTLDGVPIIQTCGVYTYFLRGLPSENDPVNLPAPPYTNLTPTQQTVGPASFSKGIYQDVQPAGAPADVIGF